MTSDEIRNARKIIEKTTNGPFTIENVIVVLGYLWVRIREVNQVLIFPNRTEHAMREDDAKFFIEARTGWEKALNTAEQLQKENAQLREVLKWYARPETYTCGPMPQNGPGVLTHIELDNGQRAKDVLKEKE